MGSRPGIIFFRNPEEDDPYERVFQQAGFATRSVPVLQFEYVNDGDLADRLGRPDSYAGLILTSPRSVQALRAVMDDSPGVVGLWKDKKVYSVGPRTGALLRALGMEPAGVESGQGERLATEIVRRMHERPLLFLCGDQRRNEIPDRLMASGVPFEELEVYRTKPVDFPDITGMSHPEWVAVFSPSSINAVGSILNGQWNGVRVAAIGPTTAREFEQSGIVVHVVAPKPSPESLLESVQSHHRISPSAA